MKRVVAYLLAIVFACALSPAPAKAWVHGVAPSGGATSPVVIPGTQGTTNQPQPAAGANGPMVTNSIGYNTITPTLHGSSGDYGYGVKGSIRWDSPQYPYISSTTQIGMQTWHTATATQIAAGQASNIDHVNVRCDNGSWFTITGPSANPNAGGQTDWNFTVNPANYSAGLHKCDAVAVPTTGPDIIAEGPASDQFGNKYETVKAVNVKIDNGASTWGTSGPILTVYDSAILNWNATGTGGASILSIGMSVGALGSGANSFIDGDSTHNASSCTPYTGSPCSGAGVGGTYHLTQVGLSAQAIFTATISGTTMTVSSVSKGVVSIGGALMAGPGITTGTTVLTQSSGTPNGAGVYTISNSFSIGSATVFYETSGAVFNTERSFYFATGVAHPTAFVSLAGNDSTGTGTATSPFLTIGRAETYVNANGTTAGGWAGAYGGTICLENGSSYAWSNPGSFTQPGSAYAYLMFRSAKAGDALCPNTGDPGGATVTNTSTSRSYWPAHTWFSSLNFIGPASNLSGGDSWYLVADHVAEQHDLGGHGGVLSSGAYYCMEVTSWFGYDGGCSGAVEVRGSTLSYAVGGDGLHDVPVAFGNTLSGVGTTIEWITGQFSTSTPNVITNVQILAPELSGYALSSVIATDQSYKLIRTDIASGQTGSNCFTGDTYAISAINDSAHTITFSGSPGNSGSCANGYTGYLYYDGAHSDDYQLQIGNPQADVYIANNVFNSPYATYSQGLFIESMGIASMYAGHNLIYTDPNGGVEAEFPVDGNNEAWITDGNQFFGPGTFGNYDNYLGNSPETLVNDQCNSGTFPMFVGTGSPTKRKAAGSTACYSSLP